MGDAVEPTMFTLGNVEESKNNVSHPLEANNEQDNMNSSADLLKNSQNASDGMNDPEVNPHTSTQKDQDNTQHGSRVVPNTARNRRSSKTAETSTEQDRKADSKSGSAKLEKKRTIKSEDEFVENRKLAPPYVDTFRLWGMVSSIANCGLYAGYNSALQYGFGSTIVALFISTLTYIVLSFMYADLGTVFSFSSGCAAYSFAAFGGIGATIVGFSYLLEYLLLASTGPSFTPLFVSAVGLDPVYSPIYWVLLISLGIVSNLWPRFAFDFSTFSSVVSLTILLVLSGVCLFGSSQDTGLSIDFGKIWQTPMPDGSISIDWFPYGFLGVLYAMPYTLYIYLGFEMITVTAEEVIDVKKTFPRAMVAVLATFIPMAFLVITVAAALPMDMVTISGSSLPFVDGIATIYGLDNTELVYYMMVLATFPANVFSIVTDIYATSRYVYGLSRGGYLPTVLSLTTRDYRRSPYIAVITTGIVTLIILFINNYAANVSYYIMDASTLMAYIAYFFDSIVFIKVSTLGIFRVLRPAPTPFGIPGAVFTCLLGGINAATLIATETSYQAIAITLAIFVGLVIPYFLIVIRKNLVESPESLFVRQRMREQTKKLMDQFKK